jgi:hypothetical protein
MSTGGMRASTGPPGVPTDFQRWRPASTGCPASPAISAGRPAGRRRWRPPSAAPLRCRCLWRPAPRRACHSARPGGRPGPRWSRIAHPWPDPVPAAPWCTVLATPARFAQPTTRCRHGSDRARRGNGGVVTAGAWGSHPAVAGVIERLSHPPPAPRTVTPPRPAPCPTRPAPKGHRGCQSRHTSLPPRRPRRSRLARACLAARESDQADLALDQQVISLAARPGPRAPVAGD